MRLPLVLVFSLALAGCAVTADIPQEKLAMIPDNANRIDVFTDKEVDASMEEVTQFLGDHGFRIKSKDDISKRIDTEHIEVGSRTKLRLTMRLLPIPGGSKIELVGAWSTDVEEATFESAGTGVSVEEQNWYPVVWQSAPRADLAYGEMIKLFDDYPATEIKYVKQ